jgi:Peptidase family M28
MKTAVMLAAALLMAAPVETQSSGLPVIFDRIREEVDPTRALGYVRQVWETDRWFTFPKFQKTAETLRQIMSDIGLREVEILGAPADGTSQVGFWTMPLAWEAKAARLQIIQPHVSEEFQILADYERVPTSLCMWSGPTSPEGITTDVIEASNTPDLQDWKGKMVLTRENPAGLKWQLAQKGAAGAINTFSENPDLKNDRQWVNAWGDRGWAFTQGNVPLPCFSVSPRQSQYLFSLLASGVKVRVKASVDSRYYIGTYPYVTGVLKGTGQEEVLVLGHTSEQGAHDNATGVAAMLETLGSLNRAVSAGKLPPPRRSIRMLAMGEMYGSMHYVSTHPERMRRTVAALCLDTPAASYDQAGTEYTFYLNPHASASFTDAFILKMAALYYRGRRPWHSHEYITGTDTYLSDPMIGVPTVWPYSGTGVRTHHNSADRPETVDRRSLADLAILSAGYLYYLASAGEEEAPWLAELALTQGQESLLKALSPILDSIAVSDVPHLDLLLHQGREKVNYARDRAQDAVRSASRVGTATNPSWLSDMEQTLSHSAQLQIQVLESAVKRRVAQLGSRRIETRSVLADVQLQQASQMVVRRRRFGTLPLDDLAPDQREGYPNGAWEDVAVKALYWCDGRRTLAEVIRLTRLEAGPTDFDFVGYFRFLAKHNYVDLVPAN